MADNDLSEASLTLRKLGKALLLAGKAIDLDILEPPVPRWPDGVVPKKLYKVEDEDGRTMRGMVTDDGDVIIDLQGIGGEAIQFRATTQRGGGKNPLVRIALLHLLNAIRVSTEEV